MTTEKWIADQKERDFFYRSLGKGWGWIEDQRNDTPSPSPEQEKEWREMEFMLTTLERDKRIIIEYNNFYDDFLHIFCRMARKKMEIGGRKCALYYWSKKWAKKVYDGYWTEGEEGDE